jgi:hypothetical protein
MGNTTISAAPVKNPVRTYFSKYFKARWQNMQNVVSNDVFYSMLPKPWLTYYNAYIRQWDEWSRGFVLQLHTGDFFSTGMGKTVCDIMTRECTKGGFRWDGDIKQSVDFMNKWSEEHCFNSNIVGNGFLNSNRVGNAIVRLNVVAGGHECYPSIHDVTNTYFEINRKDDIVRAIFIDFLSSDTVGKCNYYCIEDRVMFDKTPYYRVTIHKDAGTVTNATYTRCALDKLDAFSQSRFNDLYGDIETNQWYKLPFTTLGCYNWRAAEKSTAINKMPGYSESCLHTALDILYAIDYNYSMAQLDMYFGRSKVLVPKEMKAVNVRTIYNGQDYKEAMAESEAAALSDDVYLKIPSNGSIDGKPVQPDFIQPDYREIAHKYIRDAELELLASKVGLSSSTLANHLTYNNSKTATEVTTETDTTDVTVSNKRKLAEQALNKMAKDVLNFYILPGKVDITWNQDGKNSGRVKEQIISEYKSGVMPLDEAVKRLHPELTQEEVNKWVAKLEEKEAIGNIFDFDKSLMGNE